MFPGADSPNSDFAANFFVLATYNVQSIITITLWKDG